jgi:hypothetical protein
MIGLPKNKSTQNEAAEKEDLQDNEQVEVVPTDRPSLSANIPTPNPKQIPNAMPTMPESTAPPNLSHGAENPTVSTAAPAWIVAARTRFENVFNAPSQKPVIQLWLEFEKLLGYPEDRKIRLTKESRPQQLSDWMQRHRLWDKAPPMDKASEFGALWRGWWKVLQPEWRTANDDGWPLVREGPSSEPWAKLMKGGGNGFVLLLLSLSWWMVREKDETRRTTESSSAFEDVKWVLQQMVQVLRAQRESSDQRDDRDDEGEDPNTRPMKR